MADVEAHKQTINSLKDFYQKFMSPNVLYFFKKVSIVQHFMLFFKKKLSQNTYGNQFPIPSPSFHVLKCSIEYCILQKKKKLFFNTCNSWD